MHCFMGAVCSIPVFIEVDTEPYPTRVDLNPVRAKDLSAPLCSVMGYLYTQQFHLQSKKILYLKIILMVL
jgi:hypothetical protein